MMIDMYIKQRFSIHVTTDLHTEETYLINVRDLSLTALSAARFERPDILKRLASASRQLKPFEINLLDVLCDRSAARTHRCT